MSSSSRTRRWRSGSSRLLALYALLFVAWGAVFTGVLYWQISGYLGAVAERTLLQRAHYYGKVADADLLGELQASEVYSMPGIDAYGLFEADGRYVAGNLVKLLRNLPDDGRVHYLQRGLRTTDALDETRSSHAFLQRRADGRILVLNACIVDTERLWGWLLLGGPVPGPSPHVAAYWDAIKWSMSRQLTCDFGGVPTAGRPMVRTRWGTAVRWSGAVSSCTTETW